MTPALRYSIILFAIGWVYVSFAQEPIDSVDRKGFIALQVHAVKTKEEEGHKVFFRNIRIRTTGVVPEPFPADAPVRDMTKNN